MDAYRICTRCIMDTTDPDITFDDAGVCSHCHRFDALITSGSYLRKREPHALDALVAAVKRSGQSRRYDCVIGVSGGVDSTYTAYVTKKMGLRPLAVHLDNGWDSELAVKNIERTLQTIGIDLYTHVLDWEEFRDLQLAFLKASTPDSEIPTDHAILAILYKVAAREGVRYILSGHNTATEGGGVAAWSQGHGDWRYIRSVHRRYGTRPLRSFVHYGVLDFAYYTLVKRIRWVQFLDYFDYHKQDALALLQNELGWKYYGGKHYESIYTRFYQGFILPRKFGFDKRRLHLSSLVWSGQVSREAAAADMLRPDYPVELQAADREYCLKKLGLCEAEFDAIMTAPRRTFGDYPSYKRIFKSSRTFMDMYHALKRT